MSFVSLGDHSNSIGLSTNEEYIDNITCASDSLQGCTVTVYNESSCVDNSRLYADCSSTGNDTCTCIEI